MKLHPARPEVARVLASEAVSNFGSMLSRLAIPWLAALQLQASPAQMALLLVADVLAAALGSLLLGAWVDRSGKRAVMLLCDAARAALLGGLALAAWQGAVGLPLLVAAAACNGVLGMGFELARSAWLAQRVPADELPRRNAQLAVAGSLSETAAFALGGWLYQGLGAALALLVDGLSYAASALCLRGVREVAAVPAATPTTPSAATTPSTGSPGLGDSPVRARWQAWLHEAAAGLRAVAAHPRLRALAGVELLLGAATALTGTAYMLFTVRELALPTGPLGMVAALGGLGAVLGGALAPALGRRWGPGRSMALGLAALTLGAACIPLAAGAPAVALAWLAAHQIVGDAGHTLHSVHDHTLRQTAVPAALLARADAGIRSLGQLATLLGALVGGALGTALGLRAVLWLAVALAAAAAALAAWRLAERTKAGIKTG